MDRHFLADPACEAVVRIINLFEGHFIISAAVSELLPPWRSKEDNFILIQLLDADSKPGPK